MHTILVADDSVTIQRAVEIVFDKEPFQVMKASSGGEALARAKDQKPDVMIVDHTMGDQSGYDVAAALKADAATQGIHVLFFATTAHPYDEARGRAAGIAGSVPKPFDCATLLDRVRTVLGVSAPAPGTFVPAASTAPSAAAAGLPRPPSLGGLGLGGLPRPPGSTPGPAGVPRPGSGLGPAPSTSPAAASSPPAAASGKPLDPFGFGAAMSSPPSAAAASTTPPTPAAPSSSFVAPQAVQTAPQPSGWQATAPAMRQPEPQKPTPSWMPSATSTTPPVVVPQTPAPKKDEFFELSDDDLGGKSTPPTPAAPATPATPATPVQAAVEKAVEAVVQQAAPAVAAATPGAAPSREALTAEARAIIEKIAWEVVPELAEVIITEELKRLLKA